MTPFTADTGPAIQTGSFGSFLRAELAPFPGRQDAVIHFGICLTLVMLIAFFLQVPLLELAVIVVFFSVMENTLLTYVASGLVITGSLTVVVINNLFLGLTIDYPFLRIFISSAVVFFGMYLFRIWPLFGNLGYMWALCIIFLQSNMPLLPSGELMLRLNLWASVVTLYPAVLACVVCTLVRPSFPSRMLPEETARLLGVVARLLDALRNGEPSPPLSPEMVERDLARLSRLLEYAALESKTIKRKKIRHQAVIATVDRLYIAAAHLSYLPPETAGPESRDALLDVRTACLDLIDAVERDIPFRPRGTIALPAPSARDGHVSALVAELREMREALLALASVADAPYPPAQDKKMPLFKPDAATNPAYIRFALKTVLATLLCLMFYKATQWEGIHTCMLTCVIMAQPSLGATAQKGLLRVVGCLIGSAVALLVTLFCIPHIDDVTWFILLTLAVLLPAAWIAVGSPRSNYAGVQIAFAYTLALLGASGPSVNLTEIRDRLIGILVGVAVSTAVHTLLWPEREETSLRRSMADLLRAMAAMAEAGTLETTGERQKHLRENESKAWNLLAQCREIRGRVALEPDWSSAERVFAHSARQWLGQAQNMLFSLHAMLAEEKRLPPGMAETLNRQADGLAAEDIPDGLFFNRLRQQEGYTA